MVKRISGLQPWRRVPQGRKIRAKKDNNILFYLSGIWSDFANSFSGALKTIKPADFIDWLVVAFLIYHAVLLVRETRAVQLVKGIAAILLVYFFATWLHMNTLTFVLDNIIGSGVLLLAVLFQPELRRALEQMGRSKITGGISGILSADASESAFYGIEALIDTLVKSAEYLSADKTGALIVIEREIKLGEIINTGTVVDSKPSVELIANLFFKNSPLHDGAMIIREGRVYAAGCYLPLSGNMEIARELGTRHRAGLGMSEESDAIVIIVSEESGAVSVAAESQLKRKLTPDELKKLLCKNMLKKTENKNDKKPKFGRAKR